MKITLEFGPEGFFKELPGFAKAIGFAGHFVSFSKGIPEADIPEPVKIDGKNAYTAEDAARIVAAAKDAGVDLPEGDWTPGGGPFDETVEAPEAPAETAQEAPEKAVENKAANSTPEPVEAKEESPAAASEAPSKVTKSYDVTDVRKILNEMVKAGHKDEMRALLTEFGAANVSGLAAEKYGEFIARAAEIGGSNG